eukprot:1549645-Karenia_brevis.AAC.1
MRRTPRCESSKDGGSAITRSRKDDMRIPAKNVEVRTRFPRSTLTLRKHPDEKISTGQGRIAKIRITPSFMHCTNIWTGK